MSPTIMGVLLRHPQLATALACGEGAGDEAEKASQVSEPRAPNPRLLDGNQVGHVVPEDLLQGHHASGGSHRCHPSLSQLCRPQGPDIRSDAGEVKGNAITADCTAQASGRADGKSRTKDRRAWWGHSEAAGLCAGWELRIALRQLVRPCQLSGTSAECRGKQLKPPEEPQHVESTTSRQTRSMGSRSARPRAQRRCRQPHRGPWTRRERGSLTEADAQHRCSETSQ